MQIFLCIFYKCEIFQSVIFSEYFFLFFCKLFLIRIEKLVLGRLDPNKYSNIKETARLYEDEYPL